MTGKNNNKITKLSVINFTPKKIKSGIDPSEVDERGPFTTLYEVGNSEDLYWKLTVLAYFNSEFTRFKDPDIDVPDVMYRRTLPLYSVKLIPDHPPAGEPAAYTLWQFEITLNMVDFRSGIHLLIDENINDIRVFEPERGTVTMPHPTE